MFDITFRSSVPVAVDCSALQSVNKRRHVGCKVHKVRSSTFKEQICQSCQSTL